ncbi:hypothetical protein TEA_006921 [Camellia sinensis var. sinensis]|uniref:Alpha/beta hydrolase fold-3 domain-containing protein n=1 Tax=Camellia sinensis var. sinensis TaxID=542762 RepID=A0A4S4D2R3_CAMSN|nr:hypothetical protein TEA_006921 [Camellia sinensis var. sinensis]
MDSTPAEEIVHDFPSHVRVYKDGRVVRFKGTDTVPPSTNPDTGVQSKDVVIDPETGLSARLYIPNNPLHNKLPILVYFHGGGFCTETAFTPTYHNYLNSLVAEASVVVVSVDYRRAPEHPLPIAYDDSWATVKWVASHSSAGGGEIWLKEYVDFDRVFFAGDSAGGKSPIGSEGSNSEMINSELIIRKEVADKLWLFVYPSSSGSDDPLINPVVDPKFSSLEELGKSGWGGVVEIMEATGVGHSFHLINPTCDNAVAMLKRVACFLNEDNP